MKHIKKFNENYSDKFLKDLKENILNELKSELNMSENPGGYQEPDYYLKSEGRSSAFEDSIGIVEKYFKNI